MKISFFILFVSVCQLFAVNGNAQNAKIKLSSNKMTVTELFSAIEKQTDYLVVYSDTEINPNSEVTVHKKSTKVSDCLDELLANSDMKYEFTNNYIILSKAKAKSLVSAQQNKKKVIGTVVDMKGETIIGATVVEKGSTNGTITDINGKFSLSVSTNSTLIISYLGYKDQEISVLDKSILSIRLREDSQTLDEVVVTGFGLSQKKASLTGAISTIGNKEIVRSSAATASGALAGKIAGVNSRQQDGRPGASTTLQIRNMGTPLYVIDGVQKDEDQFNNLDFNDIESIAILKDASASIYGVRAANGVVVVTTKKGKLNSKNTVSLNTYYGWQSMSRFASPADTKTYLTNYIQSETIQGKTNYIYSKEDYQKWIKGTEKGFKSFDWLDFIWNTSPQYYLNANVSGGSEKTNYYFSIGHLNQDAMIKNYGGFQRTNIQMNIESQINDNLKVGASMNGRIEYRVNPGVPQADDYWLPMFAVYRNLPTKRPYANDNPNYPTLTSSNAGTNFAWLNYDLSGKYEDKWRVMQLNGNVEYKIFDGLKAKALFGYYIAYEQKNNQEYTYKLYGYDKDTDTYPIIFQNNNPWRERQIAHVEELSSNIQLAYDKTFEAHHITGVLGFESTKRDAPRSWLHSIPTANSLHLIDYETMDTYDDIGNNTEARLGWMFRMNYDYANKYLLDFSSRYDGSWKFPTDNRWGFFPSASVGWRISEENFWQESKVSSVFSDFKIRASYGLVGSDDISGYSPFDYMEGYNYKNGGSVIDGEYVLGTVPRGLPVRTLSWIKAKILDIGADISFLDNALGFQIDYFQRKRDGLPASRYDVLIPNEVGFNLPKENLNSDMNRGIDLAIIWRDKIKEFTYSAGGNLTFARKYDWEQYKPRFANSWDEYRNSINHRYANINWGLEADGQFKNWEEITTWPIDNDRQGNKTLRPGDIKYKDINKDGIINSLDERPIGYSESGTPILNFGINLTATWKGFDLGIDFTGGALSSFYANWEQRNPFHDGGNNPQYYMEDTWHLADIWDAESELIPGKYPTLLIGNSSHSNYWNSTFWKKNISYIKLRNLELGYKLPKQILQKALINELRIYIAGTNLFTLTNKEGFDPENTSGSGLQYPTTRIINLGMNLKF